MRHASKLDHSSSDLCQRASVIFLAIFALVLAVHIRCEAKEPVKELVPWPIANVKLLRDLPYGPPANNGGHLLDLYLPADFPKPLPLIICIHGGGWTSGDKAMFPVFLLPSMGYAVASINYRLTDEAKFPAQIDDCWLALNWLLSKHAQYGLDPNRIGVWGGSAGAHLAALMGLGYPPKTAAASAVKAVCDWCGPTDLVAIGEKYPASSLEKQRMEKYITKLLGPDLKLHPEIAKAASPMTYLRANAPPFLIMHGDADPIVPVSESISFCKKLVERGTPCELVVIRGGKHDFYSPDREKQVGEFFDKAFKAHRAKAKPEPSKTDPPRAIGASSQRSNLTK